MDLVRFTYFPLVVETVPKLLPTVPVQVQL